ncbi:MAG TPA: SBBP repeat-containing protein, partial [Myxococcales bacterium]|nr:SBBP repeat-containing protein [Myxococcales bacterium]
MSLAATAALVGLAVLVLAPPRSPRSRVEPFHRRAAGPVPRPAQAAAIEPSVSAAPGAPAGVLRAVGSGGTVFFSPDGVSISLPGPDPGQAWALRWSVQGAGAVAPEGEGPLPGEDRLYVGDDPRQWREHAPRFAGALYRQLRPGLDVRATPVERGVRLDITATPEALRDTWFRWEGQTGGASRDGDRLALATPHGAVTQTLEGPVRIAEVRQAPDAAEYRLESTSPTPLSVPGTFSVGIAWSGYLAGAMNESNTDEVNEIHLDPAGNLFVVGQSASPSFPVTVGPSNTSQNAYVTKISPAGTILWSTVIGGSASENGEELAFAPGGDIVVVGRTRSSSLPGATGRYDTSLGGVADAFVARLNASGSLQWATYLGGTGEEYALTVAIDPAGNIWVGGWTGSTDFPFTPGAFKTTNSGPSGAACGSNACDDFIAELNPTGTALLFASYFGGTGIDEVYDMELVDGGTLLLAGDTTSTDLFSFIPGVPTFQGSFQGGTYDGFLLGLALTP